MARIQRFETGTLVLSRPKTLETFFGNDRGRPHTYVEFDSSKEIVRVEIYSELACEWIAVDPNNLILRRAIEKELKKTGGEHE
jgi:hypothetical protein